MEEGVDEAVDRNHSGAGGHPSPAAGVADKQ